MTMSSVLGALSTAAVGQASTCGMQSYAEMACMTDSYTKDHVDDADACCALCDAEGQCTQWTFHGDSGKCFRTSATVAPSSKALATCGIKHATPTPAPAPSPVPPTPVPVPSPPPTPVPPPSPAPKGAPNVILMMADDMGWGDVGYNNGEYSLTPNLDAMAAGANSIRFDNFYAGGAVCSPTRASVYSGRTPNRNCIWSANVGHLHTSEFTILEAAKEAGYATSHFGKWHLGAFNDRVWSDQDGDLTVSNPGTHGADWWYATEHSVPTATPNCACFEPIQDCVVGSHKGKALGSCDAKKGNAPSVAVNYFYPDPQGEYNGLSAEAEKIPGDDSEWLYGKFESWLRRTLKADASQPFFSVIWWHPPHKDFVAMPELAKPYLDAGAGGSEADYLGSISGIDIQIGHLRSLLAELKIADNTMLFFTSDNGALSGSPGGETSKFHQGLRGYKHDLTEGGIRVPGILEYPHLVKRNMVTNYPAATMDYLPTFMDAIGLKHPQPSWPLDGTSLLPLIRGEVVNRSQPIGHIFEQDGVHGKGLTTPFQAWGPNKFTGAKGDKVMPSSAPSGLVEAPEYMLQKACQASWRVDNLKLLAWRPETGKTWQYALFDIHQDPGENRNIADQEPQAFSQMFMDMWKWAEGVYNSQLSETQCGKTDASNLAVV